MFAGFSVSEPATFAVVFHYASRLPSPARSTTHAHRKDSSAAQEPRRVAADSGRSAMGVDAPDAQGGDFRAAGSKNSRWQEGHRTHRDGPLANPGAGGRASGTGRGLGSAGTRGQLRLPRAPD